MYQDLVRRAQAGSSQAQEEILRGLKPLVLASIIRYSKNRRDLPDQIQEGYLVILEKIRAYDFDKGVNFLGYIKPGLAHYYLNRNRQRDFYSLNDPYGEEGLEKIDLLEAPDQVEERIISMEGDRRLYGALEKLSPRERQVVFCYYFRRESMVDLAERLGLSYRTVVNTKVNAIKKLRKYY